MSGIGVRVVLVVTALLATACGGDGQERGATRPSSPATLRIVEPEPGAVVEGPSALVRLELDDARIIEEVTTDIRGDEGHIHLRVDGRVVSELAGLEYELTDLEPGTHVLQAELVAGDHAPFNPRITQTSTFTVQ